MMNYKTTFRKLHHSHAVNWYTIIYTLGLLLFAQLLGISVKREAAAGNLTPAAADTLLQMLTVGMVLIFGYFGLLCVLWYLGPRSEV